MPAASDTTSVPGAQVLATSARTAAMSCGLTTSTRVSAAAAASALSTTSTPYLLGQLRGPLGPALGDDADRSVPRPDRISPDSRVSPITPAPTIAMRCP